MTDQSWVSDLLQGPPGPVGPPGPTGPPGPAGANVPNAPAGDGNYILNIASSVATWVAPTLDMIGPAFAISSFTGAQTVEAGASIVNPSFTAAYSSAAASASITNGDSIDSPYALTTPFTSAALTGTFSKNATNAGTTPTSATTTFTLTAIAATTKTAAVNFTWQIRSFGGTGTAGATGATASSSNAALSGASGALTGVLLSAIVVGASGTTFGPYSPAGGKIYLLLPHTATAHTFVDGNGFGFPMTVTTISFTNQNGAVINMDLYESTNPLFTSFTVRVAT